MAHYRGNAVENSTGIPSRAALLERRICLIFFGNDTAQRSKDFIVQAELEDLLGARISESLSLVSGQV